MADPDRDAELEDAIQMLGIPVRLDATLCAPGEVWLEGPDGDTVRVWPPAPDSGREDHDG